MRLILVDFDDTVTDNLEADYYSFIKTKNEIGFGKEMSIKEFKKLRKNRWLAEEIIRKMIDSNNHEIIKSFDDIRRKILMEKETQDKVRLNEGMPEILDYLRRKGFVIAIATYKSDKKFVEGILGKFGISRYFDNIFCNKESNSRNVIEAKKRIYIEAIKHYGIEKENVVVVGNLPDDLAPARDMHIRTIGIVSNYSKKEDLEKYGEVISNIRELKRIL